MTLPLYLASPAELAPATVGAAVVLSGAEARHAVTVRRTRVGERLQLADGHGQLLVGTVESTGRDELVLRVEQIEWIAIPEPRFVLVQALAKNDRDDQAIEAATELGVDEVVPWQAQRSIVQWRGERGEKAWRKWDAVLLAATKQSRRPRRPHLGPVVTTRELAARVGAGGTAYLLHEDATTALASQTLPPSGEVLVIVGPEGGIPASEVDELVAAGALPVRLGSSVLRSSSAGPAALAVLNAQGRWLAE